MSALPHAVCTCNRCLIEKAYYARDLVRKADELGDEAETLFGGDDADIAATVLSSFSHVIGAGQFAEVRGRDLTEAECKRVAAAVKFQQEDGLKLLSPSARERLDPVLADLNAKLVGYVDGSTNAIDAGRGLAETFNNKWEDDPALAPLYTDWEFARLARTEAGFAYNAEVKGWLGEEGVSMAAVESVGEEIPIHPNCCTGETLVLAPGVFGGYSAWYAGDLVELVLANGARLTVTVNHQFLTRNGFASAKSLHQGDSLLYCGAFERVVTGNPDDDGIPTRIDDVVKATAETFSGTTTTVPVSPVDFHGDGGFMQGDVHIVRADGLAQSAGESETLEQDSGEAVATGDAEAAQFARAGTLAEFLLCAGHALDRPVRGIGASPVLLGRHARSSDDGGLMHGAQGTVGGGEPPQNDSPRMAEAFHQVLDRFAGEVESCDIAQVNIRAFRGHVYDLQTVSTLYVANGLLSSNCLCVNIPLSGSDGIEYMVIQASPAACPLCDDISNQTFDAVP